MLKMVSHKNHLSRSLTWNRTIFKEHLKYNSFVKQVKIFFSQSIYYKEKYRVNDCVEQNLYSFNLIFQKSFP